MGGQVADRPQAGNQHQVAGSRGGGHQGGHGHAHDATATVIIPGRTVGNSTDSSTRAGWRRRSGPPQEHRQRHVQRRQHHAHPVQLPCNPSTRAQQHAVDEAARELPVTPRLLVVFPLRGLRHVQRVAHHVVVGLEAVDQHQRQRRDRRGRKEDQQQMRAGPVEQPLHARRIHAPRNHARGTHADTSRRLIQT